MWWMDYNVYGEVSNEDVDDAFFLKRREFCEGGVVETIDRFHGKLGNIDSIFINSFNQK